MKKYIQIFLNLRDFYHSKLMEIGSMIDGKHAISLKPVKKSHQTLEKLNVYNPWIVLTQRSRNLLL